MLGEENSYTAQGISVRNRCVTERQQLIIDPGAKEITGANQDVEISGGNFPEPDDFPNVVIWDEDDNGCVEGARELQGTVFTKLGDLKTDSKGNLIVLGGHGDSWGLTQLEGYGGGSYWFDDISDGSITCEITLSGAGSPLVEKPEAWVIVGPPDFAPELVNISSWDDTSFDVAVRELSLVPEMYDQAQWSSNNGWNPDCIVSYERDILPIINRFSGYHWVANVQSMIAFSSNIFDFSDPTTNADEREKYFWYFRELEPQSVGENVQTTLFSGDKGKTQPDDFTYTGIPLMPLNSGSNSVSEVSIKKFLALTETQYFLLGQWSQGKFVSSKHPGQGPTITEYPLSSQDRASIGNVVGLPQCPGIEVTWTTQNQAIYEKVAIADNLNQLQIEQFPVAPEPGNLTPERDECEAEDGCEPGDLTKRMAIPWQADYYNCSIQLVNYTDPNVNKVDSVPKRPTYYAYWWPPQAPWNVINGLNTIAEPSGGEAATIQQESSDTEMAGLQMNYARGINSYTQMVNNGWAALGFIRNVGDDETIGESKSSELFPYFVETERNYDEFQYVSLSYDQLSMVVPDLKPLPERQNKHKARIYKLMQSIDKLERWMVSRQNSSFTFADIAQTIDEGENLKKEILQMAGETRGKDIRQLKDSLQKSLEAVENFREIKVNRKPGEVLRSGQRFRF